MNLQSSITTTNSLESSTVWSLDIEIRSTRSTDFGSRGLYWAFTAMVDYYEKRDTVTYKPFPQKVVGTSQRGLSHGDDIASSPIQVQNAENNNH